MVFTSPGRLRGLFVISLAMFLSTAVSAGFVTTATFNDDVTTVAVSTFVYVGRANTPTVLVYDPLSSALLQEVSLLAVAQGTFPTGVTSMTVGADSSIIVGTTPVGEVFRLTGITASSLGTIGSIDTIPIRSVTAIHRIGDALYIGGEPGQGETVAPLFKTSSGSSLSGLSAQNFGADTRPFKVTSISSIGDSVFVGTADTPFASGLGRLYFFQVDTKTGSIIFEGDTTIPTMAATNAAILFTLSDSGEIRSAADTRVTIASVGDTSVNALLFAEDSGSIAVTYVGSETGLLRRLRNGLLEAVDNADSRLNSINGLAFLSSPYRIYGVGRRAGGSLLFYYDFAPPRITGVFVALDTAFSSGSTPETFQTPLTWGDYVIFITTDEKLKAAPTVTLTYADASQQTVAMGGADTQFSANFSIASNRPQGTVVISIIAIDDAGNTGTVILSGGTFELKSFGSSAIANNLVRVPSGDKATIRYSLTSQQNVSIKIYNMRGIEIADLSPGLRPAGQYQDITWGGLNSYGSYVASGVYMIRIQAGNEIQKTHRVMLIR